MSKFDAIKMQDLVKVEDPDSSGGITLVFKDGTKVQVSASGGKLTSQVTTS